MSDVGLISQEEKSLVELRPLLDKVKKYSSEQDISLIKKSYLLSKKAHSNQYRKTGEPYISHPLEVAHILADLNLDGYSIVSGLLHDVVEDTPVTLKDIKSEFGSSISEIVDGLTKLSQISFKSDYQKESENIRKMIISMSKDVRVILVKLADRLHNMRTLDVLSEKRRFRIANETLNIYAPLAGRLGLNSIKIELEDLSFKYIYPEVYHSIFKQFEKEKPQREKYIKYMINFLTKDLSQKTNIRFEVKGRTKNMYSIYRKMQIQNVDYGQVYDIIAFRIYAHKVHECYELLGWIHSLWKPIHGRFKDFIAVPKSNNYQSLHTTVIGPQGKRVEIQIRTYEMHDVAEKGVATHWKYKEEGGNLAIDPTTFKKFRWLQDLVTLHQNSQHSNEFLENVKKDLFESEIYVFTPTGDVKELSAGATPIDFAFVLHTDLGMHLKEAKVNDSIVSIKHSLKNGDVVEITTSNKCYPRREWLNHCVTSKARSRIRSYIREEERKMAIQTGMKLFEKSLEGIKPEKFFKNSECKKLMINMGLNTPDDVFSQIGYGKINSKNFIQKVMGTDSITPSLTPTAPKKEESSDWSKESFVTVEGLRNIVVQSAQCCSPVPGEEIMGYMSPNRGIVIHRNNCDKFLTMNSDRFIEVHWKDVGQYKQQVFLQILCQDKQGLLNDISIIFKDRGINILHVDAKPYEHVKVKLVVSIEVESISKLNSVISALERIKVITSVSRIAAQKV